MGGPMLDKALAVAVAKAKLTGLVAVATLAGAGGGAYVLASAATSPTTTLVTNAAHGSPQGVDLPDAADTTRPDNSANRAHNHGWCVSQVARSKQVGGPHHNHGGAVSAKAKSDCGKTGNGATDNHGKKPASPGKSAQPHGTSGSD